jgi:hypothetical protein
MPAEREYIYSIPYAVPGISGKPEYHQNLAIIPALLAHDISHKHFATDDPSMISEITLQTQKGRVQKTPSCIIYNVRD